MTVAEADKAVREYEARVARGTHTEPESWVLFLGELGYTDDEAAKISEARWGITE